MTLTQLRAALKNKLQTNLFVYTQTQTSLDNPSTAAEQLLPSLNQRISPATESWQGNEVQFLVSHWLVS